MTSVNFPCQTCSSPFVKLSKHLLLSRVQKITEDVVKEYVVLCIIQAINSMFITGGNLASLFLFCLKLYMKYLNIRGYFITVNVTIRLPRAW